MWVMNIYPSITTTKKGDWRDRIQEAHDLGLTEVCFFPTCLSVDDRDEAFEKLKQAGIKRIPFIHLRTDMTVAEIQKYQQTFAVDRLNVHASGFCAPPEYDIFREHLYVENSPWHNGVSGLDLAEERREVSRFAGICLDVAHLEDDRRHPEAQEHFQQWQTLLQNNSCGVWHVSASKTQEVWHPKQKLLVSDWHSFEELSEFDYLVRYREYRPPILALELENTLAEQLQAKAYIQSLFSKI
jgi:hypothetical protein